MAMRSDEKRLLVHFHNMRAWLPVAALPTLSLVFPLLLCIFPSFFRPLFFGNFIRGDGDLYLLRGVQSYGRNFYIIGEAGRLGCWHILPRTLSERAKRKKISDEGMENLLTTKNYSIVIYLHGRGYNRGWLNRVDTYNVLSAMDLHVLSLDYRGFGDSIGYPSEVGIIADSILLFNYAKKLASENPVFLWGHSMGTAVGTGAAAKLSQVNNSLAGLILESPFNNAIDAIVESSLSAAWRWTPWFNLLVKQSISRGGINFSSDHLIKLVTSPILIMHAADDEVIPLALAEKLHDAALSAGRDVTFITFAAKRGLLHKHINKASELPHVIKKFMDYCTRKQTPKIWATSNLTTEVYE